MRYILLIGVLLASTAWGAQGPWAVVQIKDHYIVYDMSVDTFGIVDDTFLLRAPTKQSALDMAEALNEAHERRTEYKWSVVPSSWSCQDEQGKKLPCVTEFP
jgi:hypothetical protein